MKRNIFFIGLLTASIVAVGSEVDDLTKDLYKPLKQVIQHDPAWRWLRELVWSSRVSVQQPLLQTVQVEQTSERVTPVVTPAAPQRSTQVDVFSDDEMKKVIARELLREDEVHRPKKQ